MAIYNVKDFGAKGNGTTVDKTAIQDAIDAAYNAGGGDVYIPTGTYILTGNPSDKSDGCIVVKSNVNIYGDGMGETILKVKDGWSGSITGVIRSPFNEETHDYSVKNLTIDGNRDSTTGKIDGFYTGVLPGDTRKDTNVMIDKVEIKDCSGYGFDPHEQTHFLTIKNSVSHGNGLDGFVADYIVNGVYENNIAYNNDRHGFNITTSTHDFVLKDNVAYGNGSAGVTIQRGSENIAFPKDISIQGGEYYNNTKEGILLRLADYITITGANVHHNGTVGVRFYGSSNSTLEDSTIQDNSQSKNGGYPEVRLEDEASTSKTYASLHNLIQGNTIIADEVIRASYGIEEKAGLTDYTTVSDNDISGTTKQAVILNGAHSEVDTNTTPEPPTGVEVMGTADADTLTDNASNNIISGKGGNDTITASAGNDTIDGGSGNDSIKGGIGDDSILGADGHDNLQGEKGNDFISGSSGNDTIDGGDGHDSLDGGSGTDSILGGAGNDTILGGGDNDTVDGGTGADSILGGSGNDSLLGGSGNDTIDGGTGDDFISGGSASDVLYGGDGNDTLNGDNSGDTLYGGKNDDSINGGDGYDALYGEAGDDTLIGGAGNDTLYGGDGADVMTGGTSTDLFVFATSGGTITDFDTLLEKIDVTAFNITAANLTFSTVNTNDTQVNIDKGTLHTSILVEHTVVDASDFIFS
ncbi:MAG: glycosyl hydrolase family 28-related protein [Rickettsiales bacterium]